MGIKILIKKTVVLTVVLSVFLGVSCKKEKKDAVVVKKEENAAHEAIKLRLNTYFEALTKQKKFNGVVFVKKGTDSLFCNVYNLNKEEQSSTKVAVESQFDIHSVSKLFARQLLYEFEKAGLITFSDTLVKFYPDFPQGERITIEMLMNHTSGLPRELVNFEGNEFDLDHAALEVVLMKQPLLFEPGTKEQYSNVGYHLLYMIIGRISGTTFDNSVAKKILMPNTLAYTGSRFYSDHKNEVFIAANHEKEGDTIVQIPNVNKDEFKQARMYSNVEDLMSFLTQLEDQSYALKMAGEDNVIQPEWRL